ncbi:hypothetical protein [Roseateles chitinivorans]|uniref:hypothetical protein n=1 Tax=Roseateles chitinivorans TaxID=2917965 RepID=UPI00118116BC|nr:hypothetical protein [Roseateles chitinivorans]
MIEFLEQHIAVKPRHGFGLIYDSAHHRGKPWGRPRCGVCTVISSSICEARQESIAGTYQAAIAPLVRTDQHWSCDFIVDALLSRRRSRTFNGIDEFNREALRVEVNTSLMISSAGVPLGAGLTLLLYNQATEGTKAPFGREFG